MASEIRKSKFQKLQKKLDHIKYFHDYVKSENKTVHSGKM